MSIDETTDTGVSTEMDDNALASAFETALSEGDQAQEPVQAAEPVQTQETQDQADGDTDESDEAVQYLDDVINQLELDPEDFMGLKVKLKIDGEEKDVTLAELRKINQLEGHVNRKSIELSEARKNFENEQAQVKQVWERNMQIANAVFTQQEQALIQQYNSEDWNTLSQTPGAVADRQMQYQQALQQLQAQYQAHMQAYTQTHNQMRERALPMARQHIIQAMPELSDESNYANALGDIKGYLKSLGADEAKVADVELDPVVFRVALDAAKYNRIASKKPDVSNKVRQAPSIQKPSSKSSLGAKEANRKKLIERANAGDSDAMAAIFGSGL